VHVESVSVSCSTAPPRCIALAERVPAGTSWAELDQALRGGAPSFGFDGALWERVQAAHLGHQLGLEILDLVPLLGARAGFFELRLGGDLVPVIPERLTDPALQEAMKKELAPPPQAASDEIVATMGGTYWDREAPHLPPFVAVGTHVEKGQPLYIIEVMKMFNKVHAPFSGRVLEIFVRDNGATVRKGQPLFRIDPDDKVVGEDPAERTRRIRANTDAYLSNVL
jgi:biotin carboxyl carrier protein